MTNTTSKIRLKTYSLLKVVFVSLVLLRRVFGGNGEFHLGLSEVVDMSSIVEDKQSVRPKFNKRNQ